MTVGEMRKELRGIDNRREVLFFKDHFMIIPLEKQRIGRERITGPYVDRIIRMRKNKTSIGDIAKVMGRTYQGIHYILKTRGIK